MRPRLVIAMFSLTVALAHSCAVEEKPAPPAALPSARAGSMAEAAPEKRDQRVQPQPGSDPVAKQSLANDAPDASVGAEAPSEARPVFAEPKSAKPSRTVPRAVYRRSEQRSEEAEEEAEDAFHEAVRDEVAALVAEAAAGEPRLVTLRVGNTMGWGCGCPWFVIPYEIAGAIYDDEFVIPLLADGVPENEYKVFGIFRLIGHYTGRRLDTGPDSDKIGERAYPEFHVHAWCYVPPSRPHTWKYDAPEMRRMKAAGAPLCKGERWPNWIEKPPKEKL